MNEFIDFRPDDVRAYWMETYVGVKKDDQVKAYYVTDAVWSDDKGDNALYMSREDDQIKMYLNDPNLISYVPELGMKQINKRACYFTKAARRQWKKGLRTGQYNSKFIDFRRDNYAGCNMMRISSESRDSMFNPAHCELADALMLLCAGYDSIALSVNFAIANHPRSFDPILCYREDIVGKVTKGELYLLEEYSELSGSLTDEVGECHVI